MTKAVRPDCRGPLGVWSRKTVRRSESDSTARFCQIRVGEAVYNVLDDGRPGHADNVVRERAEQTEEVGVGGGRVDVVAEQKEGGGRRKSGDASRVQLQQATDVFEVDP